MKRLASTLILTLSLSACDTPLPEPTTAPVSSSSDAGTQTIPAAQKVVPVGPIGGPGGTVPHPGTAYCDARLAACGNLCHAVYGGWCALCDEACYNNCEQEWGLCVWSF